MKQIIIFIALAISLFTHTAQAAQPAVYVACYGDEEAFTMGFHAQETWATYIYSHWDLQDTFESDVSPWGAAHSTVTTMVGTNTAILKAQTISGDVITPIINTSAELKLVKDANGSWILKSAEVYHNSLHYNLRQFVGHSCYVQ